MSGLRDTSAFSAVDDRRVLVLSSVATGIFALLVLRLFYLQIVKGPDMARQAEINRTQVIPLMAPRGLVYDRTGEVLVDNAPRFSLLYSHSTDEGYDALRAEIARRLPAQAGPLLRKMEAAKRSGKMTRLAADIPREVALALLERRMLLPGSNVLVEPQRRARHGALASHVLGYVDEVNPAELERHRDRYHPGQVIGKNGIERLYDAYLRGQDGGLQFEMNAMGRHVQIIRRIPSEPGSDVHLAINFNLQQAAEQALARSPTGRGAAVVIDPRSGAVLALASAPGFDYAQGMAPYLVDPRLPLFNRALQGTYPAGSVFKMITSAAGLQYARWNTGKTFFCNGPFKLGTKEFACHGTHYRQDFFGALAVSCNIYFYNMGLAIGPDYLEAVAKAFGLGEKSGLDVPTESSGLIPGKAWKKRAMRGQGWFDGDTLNLCIGQGFVTVTPLQAAVLMAAVANHGIVWKPYLVDKITDPRGAVVYHRAPEARRRVDLDEPVWNTLHKGLAGVVLSGSGRVIYRPDLRLGAKTGTAQNPHGEDHAWFAAFGGRPGEPPSLALAVFVENGGKGSVAAGPVAREIINAAFPIAQQEPAPVVATPVRAPAVPPVPKAL